MKSQIVTEEVALTKWCPYALQRHDFVDGASYNRHWDPDVSSTFDPVPTYSCCVGGRCMKWEWHDHEHGTGRCTRT